MSQMEVRLNGQLIDVSDAVISYDMAEPESDQTSVVWFDNTELAGTVTVKFDPQMADYIMGLHLPLYRSYRLHQAGLQMVKKRNGHYILKTLSKGVH